MPYVISNSEIQLYKQCRRSWYVQYYLQRQPKFDSVNPVGATWMGTRLHAALEAYYMPDLNISPTQACAILSEIYIMDVDQWPEHASALWNEWELASTMLKGYFEWIESNGLDAHLEVISPEREYVVPLSEDISIRGRLDVTVRDKHSGAYLFLDHKTCIAFLKEDYLDRDEQALFYMMLQRLSVKEPNLWLDGGIFNMLRKVKRGPKAKPPFYMRTTVRHNSDTLNSMYRRTYQVAHDILDLRGQLDSGIRHDQIAYPHPTADCSWRCPLAQGGCVMMDDGSDWQGYLEEQYTLTDPYARYSDEGYLGRLDQKGKL